jgi:hypothetical protein
VSRSELKKIVDRSSPADRLFLAAYLQHLTSRDDSALHDELAAAHREIERGKKVNLRQLKQLDRSLAKSGL